MTNWLRQVQMAQLKASDFAAEIEELITEMEEALENMPERLQNSLPGETMQERIDLLQVLDDALIEMADETI